MSFCAFVKSCLNLTNLLVFVFLFSSVSFDYYLINFYLKYIPGNVYVNSIVSSVSAAVATYLSGILVVKLGSQNAILASYVLSFFAGILLMVAEANEWGALIAFSVLAAMFGVSSAFTILYSGTL